MSRKLTLYRIQRALAKPATWMVDRADRAVLRLHTPEVREGLDYQPYCSAHVAAVPYPCDAANRAIESIEARDRARRGDL